LISALEFFIAAPYSEATVSLLAKYQFNNHININYDKEVLPKIIKFEEKKNFPVLYNFKRLLSHFTNVYVIGSNKDLFFEAGDAYKSLINYIEPQKSSYQSLKLLKLFYFLMYRNLLKLKELRESEFRKNNPDYNEDDYYDYDDSEPYTHDDFINDVFEGDESYGWNID